MSALVNRPSNRRGRNRRSCTGAVMSCLQWVLISVCVLALVFAMATSLLTIVGVVQATDPLLRDKPQYIASITKEDLETLVNALRGDDLRIMRWNAEAHTRKQQHQGACKQLPAALDLLIHTSAAASIDGEELTMLQALALEYTTFCITDNPVQRKIFSTQEGIHKAVVYLVASPNPAVSATAAHVIYTASFANKENQVGFFRAGAVNSLSKLILRYKPLLTMPSSQTTPSSASMKQPIDDAQGNVEPRADQTMWSLAALQNLAASYCATKDDGRCYWTWRYDEGSPFHILHVTHDALPVVSDGTSVRYMIIKEKAFIPHVVHLACDLKVLGDNKNTIGNHSNPFPGDDARIGRDEDHPNLVAWAAAGVLKNIALDRDARDQMKVLDPILMPCLCEMEKSPDWLEENKAQGSLHHLRIGGDPCWWTNHDGADESMKELRCIDENFIDSSNYNCGDYGDANEEECTTTDVLFKNLSAAQACCGCGGGLQLLSKVKVNEEL